MKQFVTRERQKKSLFNIITLEKRAPVTETFRLNFTIFRAQESESIKVISHPFIIGVLILIMNSCNQKTAETTVTSNANFQIEECLMEID